MREFNGCVCGRWRKDDLETVRRTAARTAWPWDKRKIGRLAARLEMTTDRVERQLRKMGLGCLMRPSPCNYCDHMVKHFDSAFCPRGRKMGWRGCGVAQVGTATCPACRAPYVLHGPQTPCPRCAGLWRNFRIANVKDQARGSRAGSDA